MIGEERLAVEGSTFVFHQTGFEGAQGQRFIKTFLRDKLRDIQYDDTRSAAVVAQKSGQPIKTVRRWQDAEVTMTTKTAVENGIVHRVAPLVIPEGAFYHQAAKINKLAKTIEHAHFNLFLLYGYSMEWDHPEYQERQRLSWPQYLRAVRNMPPLKRRRKKPSPQPKSSPRSK